MENQDFLQLGTINPSLPILGQQQGNFCSSDFLQLPNTNLNQRGSFSDQMVAEIVNIEIKIVEYDQYLHESVLGSTFELVAPATNSELSAISDGSDLLTGDVTPVNIDAVLDLAVTTVNKQLESFATDEEFLDKIKLAFGNDWNSQKADALIQDLANGEAMPKIEILPAANLKANGAFGEGTIYLSDEFLTENAANPEAVAGVLLEEIGHHVDQELSNVDSPGDEGNIFARLVQDETISEAELEALIAENDSATISLNGQQITVELADPPYPGYLLKYEPGESLSYDANVEQWQQRMKDRGWDVDVDGLYGLQSESIARQFQQAKDLAIDGIVGPQTWEATFETGTPPFPSYLFKYESGEALSYDANVEQWQQRMKDLGKNIDVDGLYGPQSAQVAREFQQQEGLSVDGIVGPQTWEASFDDVTPPPVDPPQPPQPPQPGPTSFRDEVVRIAQEEWEFFAQGTLEETEEGAWQRIAGEYWQTVGVERTDIDTSVEVGSDDNPWSAAFISWVMQKAGAGEKFEYSASHSTYITDAIEDRNENDSEAAFFGYRLDEYSPEVGDLVGYARDEGVGYDTPAPYNSHSDIVVAKRDGEIDVIGGNVENSVTLKTLEIDAEGRLIDTSADWFVVLSNQLGDNDTPPPPTGSTPYDATEIVNAVPAEIREYAVNSVPLILSAAEESGVTDPGQIAYILASAEKESLLGRYMEELASGEEYEGREDLGNTEPGDGPRFKGRGYVQITGRNNYTNWSERLGVDLVGNPELAATDLDIAATILVQGMRDGAFTGVGLSDYINGDSRDFVEARQIVNGNDDAQEVASFAERYYEVLTT